MLRAFARRISGLLAPILAEVLYEKGRVWPLAALGPFMILVAIASGKFFLTKSLCATPRVSILHLLYLENGLTRVDPLGMPLSRLALL